MLLPLWCYIAGPSSRCVKKESIISWIILREREREKEEKNTNYSTTISFHLQLVIELA